MNLSILGRTIKKITAQDQTIISAFVAIFLNSIYKNTQVNKASFSDIIKNHPLIALPIFLKMFNNSFSSK
jgi:hypothetical protein